MISLADSIRVSFPGDERSVESVFSVHSPYVLSVLRATFASWVDGCERTSWNWLLGEESLGSHSSVQLNYDIVNGCAMHVRSVFKDLALPLVLNLYLKKSGVVDVFVKEGTEKSCVREVNPTTLVFGGGREIGTSGGCVADGSCWWMVHQISVLHKMGRFCPCLHLHESMLANVGERFLSSLLCLDGLVITDFFWGYWIR